MTERAKKISELPATTAVANTDKIVVLKDPSGSPSTRSVTVNTFALSIAPIISKYLPGAVVSVGNTTVASNNDTSVPWFTVANTKMFEIFYTAVDLDTEQDRAIGHVFVTSNNTSADAYNQATSSIGSNPIDFSGTASINTTANTITLSFARSSATTADVLINYQLTTYA